MEFLTLDQVNALLESTSRKRSYNPTGAYMLLDDGTKVPLDTSRIGSFHGKAGTTRKYYGRDVSVIAYKAS